MARYARGTGPYHCARWSAWFAASCAELKLNAARRTSLSKVLQTFRFGRPSTGLISQWTRSEAAAGPKTAYEFGRALSVRGIESSGPLAVYAAGHYVHVLRFLREHGRTNPSSAVMFYRLLPEALDWLDWLDVSEGHVPVPLMHETSTWARSRLSGHADDIDLAWDESTAERSEEEIRAMAPSERRGWELATLAIEHAKTAIEHPTSAIASDGGVDEARDRAWSLMREWAARVDPETYRNFPATEFDPVRFNTAYAALQSRPEGEW